jgi:hypothetical protein
MKLCPKCNLNKDIKDFRNETATKDGLQSWCRLCMNKIRIAYDKENPWANHFKAAKERIHGKKSKSYIGLPFTLTRNQVKQLWERDKANQLKEPSLDRIINKLGYTFENCRFVEMIINRKKH